MKLYFEDRYGRLREIANVENKEQVAKSISDFLNKYNYKSYYTRSWISKGETVTYITYDVGSHSEFFKLEFNSYEDAENFIKS